MVINTALRGDEHHQHPFNIGYVVPERGYVHVLDELTLEVVLGELDTISDLVAYLRKKEELLSKPRRTIIATGEEQLVATYLKHLGPDEEHDFPALGSSDSALFDEGTWESFIKHPSYRAKKEADAVSYSWDRLIEHFVDKAQREDDSGSSDLEPALRVLASEPRIRRRQLAEQLLDALKKKVSAGSRFARLSISDDFSDTAYLFLVLPKPDYVASYGEYRAGRRALLFAYCKVAKLRAVRAKLIVGIATEPSGGGGASEDLGLLDTTDWTEDRENEARELQKELEIFQDERVVLQETRSSEYPAEQIYEPEEAVLASQQFRRYKGGLNRAQRQARARRDQRAKRRKIHKAASR